MVALKKRLAEMELQDAGSMPGRYDDLKQVVNQLLVEGYSFEFVNVRGQSVLHYWKDESYAREHVGGTHDSKHRGNKAPRERVHADAA